MADRFFDTSAAAKDYRLEVGTAKVDALLAEAGARHFLSDLSVVELHSVLARLVRTGQITVADFQLARGRFLADIAGSLWTIRANHGIPFPSGPAAVGSARPRPQSAHAGCPPALGISDPERFGTAQRFCLR
jgi:hypothetical protein